MLDILHIENIAVAKNVDIEFGNGFNVLTGETGAGKSIIIDAINMILGAKISKEIIRHGKERAVVSAFFSNVNDEVYALCDEFGIEYDRDDAFLLYRSYSVDGKNIVKINNRPATISQLKQIGALLVNIHGQNENQSFINKSNHISLLDEYCNLDKLLAKYSNYYYQLNEKKNQIASLLEENKKTEAMVDLYNYQIKEINSAKLNDENEEEKLEILRKKLKSAEKIVKSSTNVYKLLCKNESGISTIVLIEKAIDSLNKITDLDPSIDEMMLKLKDFKSEIEDIAERTLELGQLDGIEEPEKQLDIIEDRLTLISRLQKKYGSSIKEIIEYKHEVEEKLSKLESSEILLDRLKKEYKVFHSEACEIATEIHNLRKKGASELSKLVKETLLFLDMPKVEFEISVNELVRDNTPVLSVKGYDDVEFMIATNVGESLSQMSKIASGGELARVMLAIKSTISNKNKAQTIIFDEIDTGVSGSTSQKIGIKLAKIAKSMQTICVTHSAQIASLCDNHFLIKKKEENGRAVTSVTLLDNQSRIDEIARIIGGIDLTEKQYGAAKDLLLQREELLAEID
ncbi:MAG: DNA repair protein RecN [Clostridia bacterium]|nr:DNA repair protein RecN [Clostridia bacterium]